MTASNTTLTVATVQHAMGQDRQTNWQQSATLIRQAAGNGAQLIVLPELHASEYFCNQQHPSCFDKAETIPGPSTDFFAALAKAVNAVLVIGVFEKRGVGVYHNTAVVIDSDGSLAGIYRKMHIPDDPGYGEKYYFTPGDQGFKPIQTSVGNLGVLICWDQWFPEAARLMALAGADMLLYPTAIGADPTDSKTLQAQQRDAWLTIQRSHAIANHLPVIISNRVGIEGDNHFWGNSSIIDAQGVVQASLDASVNDSACFTLDLTHTEMLRRIWPYFRDRRIDHYQGLLHYTYQQNEEDGS